MSNPEMVGAEFVLAEVIQKELALRDEIERVRAVHKEELKGLLDRLALRDTQVRALASQRGQMVAKECVRAMLDA